jgi:hypothetical protein
VPRGSGRLRSARPSRQAGECVCHLHANTRIYALIRTYTNIRAASSPRQARRVRLSLRQAMRFRMSISAPSLWTSCRYLSVYLIFILVLIFVVFLLRFRMSISAPSPCTSCRCTSLFRARARASSLLVCMVSRLILAPGSGDCDGRTHLR